MPSFANIFVIVLLLCVLLFLYYKCFPFHTILGICQPTFFHKNSILQTIQVKVFSSEHLQIIRKKKLIAKSAFLIALSFALHLSILVYFQWAWHCKLTLCILQPTYVLFGYLFLLHSTFYQNIFFAFISQKSTHSYSSGLLC